MRDKLVLRCFGSRRSYYLPQGSWVRESNGRQLSRSDNWLRLFLNYISDSKLNLAQVSKTLRVST